MNAKKAIKARISELAPEADHDQLVKLADAYSKVEFGPNGANNTTRYAGRYGVDNTHGKRDDGKPLGFS